MATQIPLYCVVVCLEQCKVRLVMFERSIKPNANGALSWSAITCCTISSPSPCIYNVKLLLLQVAVTANHSAPSPPINADIEAQSVGTFTKAPNGDQNGGNVDVPNLKHTSETGNALELYLVSISLSKLVFALLVNY